MTTDLTAPRSPHRLRGLARARLAVALAVGSIAGAASRLAGRGSGASIRGLLMMKVAPDALANLLPGHTIVSVSGTNGKTTTTHLIAAAVRAAIGAERVVTNADGANLHYGIASALAVAPGRDVAILETDERVVPDLLRLGHPAVLVLLNFSRDQLDRNHEITSLARSWRLALELAGADGPVVIANADDPLITWAVGSAHKVVWVDTAASWTQDASLCPECGRMLTRADGRWACPTGDLVQPEATWQVDRGGVIDPGGTRWELDLQVPGSFNVANGACALAAAVELGIDTETAIRGMHTVASPAGRYATANFGSTTARLLLAKNPAGWAEVLPLANRGAVVLAVDSAVADGRDMSWLWDVEYEQLAGRNVVAAGPRAQDLSVRLLYAGVEHRVVPDLAAALAGHDEPVDVLATYTPFQRLRKLGGLK